MSNCPNVYVGNFLFIGLSPKPVQFYNMTLATYDPANQLDNRPLSSHILLLKWNLADFANVKVNLLVIRGACKPL